MDLRKIKKLVDLFEASKLSELEITEGESSIRITKNNPALAAVAGNVVDTALSTAVAVDNGQAAVEHETGHEVESPTVGTFYSKSSPDADAFVTLGTKVSVGSTLCVVEAMKTFNEIQADKAGIVSKINKVDGDPVEYGEVLFVIA